MSAATGLTVVKRFTYRGSPEDYSNTYWLTGAPPGTAAEWRALFDAVVLAEKTIYPSTVTVVHGYGYADDSGHKGEPPGTPVAPAVWSVDMTISPETPVAGTLGVAGGAAGPGDLAVWVRWRTSRLNVKGKAIYLRKFFHPAMIATGTADLIMGGQTTALNAFGTKMFDGTLIGTRKITAAGQTDVITSRSSSAYVTTRTLKRRGKRPGS